AAAVGTITRNRKDSKEVGEIERVKGRLICSNCGTENERGERSCSVCGETLSAGKGEDQET
ncbi:MAG: zinc-ribbon domain-containing protein, partial [Candidatus Thermoplasmatota archaeon]